MLSASHRSRKLMASRPARVRSFRSRTMRRPFASDLISVSNSAISSSSIWPLSVKTTSSFSDLLILNMLDSWGRRSLCCPTCCCPSLHGFWFTAKQESSGTILVAHANAIAAVYLAAGHQVRQGLHQQALDGPLQVPRAIPEIGALHQQNLPGAIGDIHQERFVCRSTLNALLHHLKLNIN